MRSSGFPYGRHERKRVSPDSEDIEPAKPSGLKAKLFERGGNPRQSHLSNKKRPNLFRSFLFDKFIAKILCYDKIIYGRLIVL